jgi:hypothetical protein
MIKGLVARKRMMNGDADDEAGWTAVFFYLFFVASIVSDNR